MTERYTHTYSIMMGANDRHAVIEWDGERGTVVYVGPMEICKSYLANHAPPPEIIPGEYDCLACGACCRAHFSRVNLRGTEPYYIVHARHDNLGWHLPRINGACPALASSAPYSCGIYASRPQSCRDLEPGSPGCLASRKAVGL